MSEPEIDLTDEQARVYEAVNQLEVEGGPGYLDDVASKAGLPREQADRALAQLTEGHGLVQQLQTPADHDPDFGPRYRAKKQTY